MAKNDTKEVLAKCLNGFDEDIKAHDVFARKVDRRYRAYRGVMERSSDAASWTNQVHPPYVLQIIETMVSSLIDPNPKWRPRARPRMDSPPDTDALQTGSRALEVLLAYQLDRDRFKQKQRPHRLQGLIAGLTAVKTFWDYQERPVKRHRVSEEEIFPGVYVPKVQPGELTEVVRDDPCSEVVDVRDLILHESATSVERAQRITHRVFYSFDELKKLERAGVFENVDLLKESRNLSEQRGSREQDLFEADRTKDQIEVLECWIDGGERVVSIGNRKVVLRDRPNPFWHGRYPFVVCSGMPDLFRVPGISEVEVIEQLQEMMWTLQNQRLDNLQLLNNAIVLIRSDVDDPDAFEFAPGEKWLVDDINQTKLLEIDPTTANISLQAEALLKSDLESISAGGMWAGGDNRAADASTATEASILTNLAQRRVAAKKQFFVMADAEVGEHFLLLDQQFLTEPRYVDIVGADGVEGYELIHPEQFRDLDFKIDVEALDESLMREQRRAEKTALLQVAGNLAPIFAAMPGQPGLNMKAFMDELLRSHEVANPDRFYTAIPQPAASMGGAPPPGQQPGATAPQATDMNSPSNAFSQSPVAAIQQQGAMTGGPANT